MSLVPGTRLGPYEITAQIGVGGMGEVYRARDTKLQRDVAIKVLPESLAHDAERMARFEREARTLASLNHPNIAAIYGFEESNGVQALVLELVEGPTLADRIAQGPIPLEEALLIARQIAGALEAAHEQGVIHRDLKPSNIKVHPDGIVKVLDFGLAKALDSAPTAKDATESPTLTSPALTGMGVILGTAGYMSPEQATGRPADKRSDVWAFGCVLFEMLTGTRAFVGEDVSDTLAAVLRGEPDWSSLPPNVPPAVVILIKQCLQKDRRERIAGMSAASFVLREPELVTSGQGAPDTIVPRVVARYPRAAAAVLLLIGAVTSIVLSRIIIRPPVVAAQPVTRLAVTLAVNQRFSSLNRRLVALSPSGTHLVYVADGRLYLRPLSRLDATPIPAVEGSGLNAPRDPFFSPDGEWVGFWQGGYLKKVSITGGTPVVICEVDNPLGASWGADGTIVFAGAQGIGRVPATAGGRAETLVKVSSGEYTQGPELLPGSRAVLFTLRTDNSGSMQEAREQVGAQGSAADQSTWDEAQIIVQSLDTGDRHVLIEGATDGRYVPSGHLVFSSRGTEFAVAFDATTLKMTGRRMPVVENVAAAGPEAHLTFSQTGVLAYVPGSFSPTLRKLAWVDRQGRETPINAPADDYAYPRVSPDGKRVAVTVAGDQGQQDIWIWDVLAERFTRVTSDPADDRYSEWTSDGRDIVFASRRGGIAGLWRQPADGGAAEQLVAMPNTNRRDDWLVPSPLSSRNSRIVATFLPTGGGADLFLLTLDSQRRLEPLLQTRFVERSAEISPDGQWLAHQSNESGQVEIYVRRTADVNGVRWLVSRAGGRHALWSRDGSELFYAAPGGGLMRVAVERGSVWKAGAPTQLLDGPYLWTPNADVGGRLYDAHGQRFLVLKPVDEPSPTTIVIVQNWFQELQRLVPTR